MAAGLVSGVIYDSVSGFVVIMSSIIVVTGASEGIGRAYALEVRFLKIIVLLIDANLWPFPLLLVACQERFECCAHEQVGGEAEQSGHRDQ